MLTDFFGAVASGTAASASAAVGILSADGDASAEAVAVGGAAAGADRNASTTGLLAVAAALGIGVAMMAAAGAAALIGGDCCCAVWGRAVALAAVFTGAADDGEAMTGALVTSACAAIELLSSFDPGRSTSETTTTAPAVAPIAVATKAMRTVRMKLGAGARYPHSG